MDGLVRGRVVYYRDGEIDHAAIVTHVYDETAENTTSGTYLINCYVLPDGVHNIEAALKLKVPVASPSPEHGHWHWMFEGQQARYTPDRTAAPAKSKKHG